MGVSESYLHFVEDQLNALGDIQTKKMFGGVGLFYEGLMFGKIGSDILYLKVDEENQHLFEAKGMQPFYSEKKKKGMPYWQVPQEVIEDHNQLIKWAQTSIKAAKSKK